MKKIPNQRIVSDYPEWHDQPFRLTVSEIENPHKVVDDFFQLYSLPNVRVRLKQWLEDALSADDVNPIGHLTLYDQVEKLIEAAHSINQLESPDEDDGDFEKGNEVDHEIIADSDNEIESEIARHKEKRLVDKLKENPKECIIEIFQIIELNDLKDNLNSWLKVALSNEKSIYDEASQRADLIIFTDQLLPLMEAMYIKSEVYKLHNTTGRTSELPKGIRDKIRINNQISHLSFEQFNEPDIALEQFFAQFEIGYSRVEIWDLLDAVISYEDDLIEGISKLNLLLYYECYLCLMDGAYILKNHE